MSRTKGHTKDQRTCKCGRHKMKPYTSDKARGDGKVVVTPERRTGISTLGKLVAKNANRAKKKAARRQGKKIFEEI